MENGVRTITVVVHILCTLAVVFASTAWTLIKMKRFVAVFTRTIVLIAPVTYSVMTTNPIQFVHRPNHMATIVATCGVVVAIRTDGLFVVDVFGVIFRADEPAPLAFYCWWLFNLIVVCCCHSLPFCLVYIYVAKVSPVKLQPIAYGQYSTTVDKTSASLKPAQSH
jgi:hypothetical protein